MKTNYKLRTVTIIITLLSTIYSFAQAPAIEWQKSLGGTGIDNTSSIIQTSDGGFVIAGNSQSNNGDVTGNHGSDDFWIVKINSDGGVIEWQKSLGGTNIEYANSIIQTSDGGYIVAGSSTSNNGDVTGNHGSGDCWIVKLSSTGTIQWQKSLGGTSFDWATSIKQTTDGYIIAGNTQSNNGDVTGNHGYIDYWVIKINSTGTLLWQKTLGGTGDDRATSIIQTTDGGYVVAGYSESNNNGNVTGNHGLKDYWIVKLNSDGGVIEWQKSLGGTHVELAHSIKQTSDGGYIVAGHAFSSDGDVIGNDGGTDFWVVKLSSTGTIQWQKSLGGTQADSGFSIYQTLDGGYIISGASNSNDGDVTGHHGIEIPETPTNDYWVIKINSDGGVIEWQKSLGGTLDDYSNSIIQTTDGGYIIAGSSNSNNGDVTGNHGNYDYWVVKLAPDNLATNSFTENTTITLFPNPAKEKITLKINYFTPLQEIVITDILGKTIYNQKLESVSTTITTSNFEKGIYFLNLIDGNQKTTKKFIVE